MLKYKVYILGTNSEESEAMKCLIETEPYRAEIVVSLENLKSALEGTSCMAVILDVDSVSLDNRTIRNLTLTFPMVCFLCVSKDRFHPDLKDAICFHIFACLNKPINPDELFYFLKCIRENEMDSRGPPGK